MQGVVASSCVPYFDDFRSGGLRPTYEHLERLFALVGSLADAIVAMRFDTSEMGSNWTEICAYGTAVRVRKL